MQLYSTTPGSPLVDQHPMETPVSLQRQELVTPHGLLNESGSSGRKILGTWHNVRALQEFAKERAIRVSSACTETHQPSARATLSGALSAKPLHSAPKMLLQGGPKNASCGNPSACISVTIKTQAVGTQALAYNPVRPARATCALWLARAASIARAARHFERWAR
jgi:hypothetical protein